MWVGGQSHVPATLPTPPGGGNDPVPIVMIAGWAQGQSVRVRKISLPPGLDLRTVQPIASRYNY
jgi:hypothetical protein